MVSYGKKEPTEKFAGSTIDFVASESYLLYNLVTLFKENKE